MAYTSHLIEEALDLAKNVRRVDGEITPAHIIVGFIKLIDMNDAYKKVLLSEDELASLDKVKQVFVDNNIDVQLVKEGMPLIAFPGGESGESAPEMLQKMLEDCSDEKSLVEGIISKNKDLFDSFREGSSISAIIENIRPVESADPKAASGSSAAAEAPAQKEAPAQAEESAQNEATEQKAEPEQQEAPAAEETKSSADESVDYLAGRTKELYKALLSKVSGQDEAILKFVRAFFNAEYKTGSSRSCPRGVIVLSGNQCTGKSYIASITSEVTGIPTYKADLSMKGLTDNLQELELFVRTEPRSLVIIENLDPVDMNAYLNDIRVLTHIINTGSMIGTRKGDQYNYKDCTFIITTRTGREIYDDESSVKASAAPADLILQSISSEVTGLIPQGNPGPVAMVEAFCDALKNCELIMLDNPRAKILLDTVRGTLSDLTERISGTDGISCLFDKKIPALILHSFSGRKNIRTAAMQTEKFIKNELFEIGELKQTNGSLSKIRTVLFEVDSKDTSKELAPVLADDDHSKVLVVCEDKDKALFESANGTEYVFASDFDEVKALLKTGISYAIIDPLYGTEGADEENSSLSLEDRDTPGTELISKIQDTGIGVHIYALASDDSLNSVDINYLLRSGISGTVDACASDAERTLAEISADERLEKKYRALGKRNRYISYKSSQKIDDKDDTVLHVSFYDLKLCSALQLDGSGFLRDADRPDTKFSDVIGAENAKEELKYFIGYLRDPKTFMLNGGKPPKGVLLYGPPGTGKTMLARAMAGESNVAFVQTSATQFMDQYVGQSEKHIRDMFRRARQSAPAIIFIDEIDAIGKARTGSSTTHYTESMLNALLTEMDGFTVDSDNPVFVLAATNYGMSGDPNDPRQLDEALLRRFDNQIMVDLPNRAERVQFIKMLLGKIRNTVTDDTVNNIAGRTTGKSPAIIQNIVDLAFRNAVRRNVILDDDLMLESFEEYSYGERHTHDQDYYESVAVHESGHAVVSYLAGEMPAYVTIVSRSNFGGYMMPEEQENKGNYTRDELLWHIRIALGGRAAEKVFYGEAKAVNTGASSDLRQATNLAMQMISSYGMSDDRLISLPLNVIMNGPLAKEYVDEVNAILTREMAYTVQLLRDNRHLVEKLSQALVASNDLTSTQIEAILKSE